MSWFGRKDNKQQKQQQQQARGGTPYSSVPYGGGGLERSSTMDFQRKYGFIPDSFTSIAQVQEKLREVGLESSNLIVGVDFTKSNEWTGRQSFGGRCLHAIGSEPNPYEQAIGIIGETLSPFDEDNLIPCFGFGDNTTRDNGVFSFYPDNRPCHGFADALVRYRTIAPYVQLSGPTSFAPIIEAAVRVVETSGGQYHVLLIIADGQVTRSVDLPPHQLSDQERATVQAIGAASNYPLSIVLVGVGDGPWDTMRAFDDNLPQRNFDNFQFVNCTGILSLPGPREQLSAKFALMALMEVPLQYKACAALNILGKKTGRMPPRAPLGPPPAVLTADASAAAAYSAPPHPYGSAPPPYGGAGGGRVAAPPHGPSPGGQPGTAPPYGAHAGGPTSYGGGGGAFAPSAPPPPPGDASLSSSSQMCPSCHTQPRSMAFQCGHQVCAACGGRLGSCPVCGTPVAVRIKLYN